MNIKFLYIQLKRQRYDTFSSVFGISFTLFFVCFGLWMIDMFTGVNPPTVNRKQCLYIEDVVFRNAQDKKVQYEPSYFFMSKYVKTLSEPKCVTIYRQGKFGTVVRDELQSFALQYTDEDFWKVLQFKFLAGRPYNRREVLNGNHVMVITKQVAETLVGSPEEAIGKVWKQKVRVIKL